MDFEKSLSFYSAYHSDPRNKLVHIVCVPIIAWTVLVFTSFASGAVSKFLCLGYFIYYMLLDPLAAMLMSPVLFILCRSAIWFYQLTATIQWIWWILLAFHVGAWVLQILSHKFYERRSPAFMDSAIQALLTAPFFIWFELLFKLGYKPDLRDRVSKNAAADIAKFRASVEKKKKNS